ncbi:MAG: MFS transporter [Planctomycetota bacterium]
MSQSAHEPTSPGVSTGQSSRAAVPALALVCFAMSLNQNVFGALNPFLRKEFGFSDESLGALVSAPGIAGTISALLLGPVVDRVGRKAPILIGTLLFSVVSIPYLCATHIVPLLIARLLTGFAAGVVLTGASAAVADLVPFDRRGKAMTWISLAILVAGVLGNPAAVLLAQNGHWRMIFWLQIGIALLAAGILFVKLPRGLGKSDGPTGALFAPLERRGIPAALGSIVLYTGAFVGVVQFFGVWLEEASILPKSDQAGFWLGLGLLGAVGALTLGGVTDKLGKHRAVLIASGIVAGGVAVLPFVSSLWALILVGAPIAMVSAARSGSLMALVTELVPHEERGRLMGLRAAAVNLGIGIVPISLAAIRGNMGSDMFFWAAALVLLLALGLVWRGVPTSSSNTESEAVT